MDYVLLILLASPAVLVSLMIWYFIRRVDSQKTVRGFEVRPRRTDGERVSSEGSE
jgi:hypothetical protein